MYANIVPYFIGSSKLVIYIDNANNWSVPLRYYKMYSLLLNNSNITFVKTLQKDFDNAKVHDRILKQSEMVEYLEIFDKNSIL